MDNYIKLLSRHRSAIMGFAILWVMAFHLPASFGFLPFDLIKMIGYGGVDIFLFLSGFGLYFSCSKDSFNVKQYYKRRFNRILPEFWLVLLVVFFIQGDFSGSSFYNLICYATTLGYWLWGKGVPYVLWYISCILLFYTIYPYYFSLFKRYGIKVPLYLIGGGFILMFLYALVCIVFFDNNNISGLAILTYSRIPIFFLGSIFGSWAKNGCNISFNKKHKVLALLLSFSAFIALMGFIKLFPDDLWVCSLYFIPFIVITPVLCIVLAVIFEKLEGINKIFAYIGTLSLELYMCHTYSYDLFDYFVGNYGKHIAILFVILLSFLAAFLLHLINKKWLQKIC